MAEEKKKKKALPIILGIIAAVIIITIIIVIVIINFFKNRAVDFLEEASNDNSNFELQDCYDQCDAWGGEVDMCKENCDASYNSDSVWNDTDEDVAQDNDTSFNSWEAMPLAVPEFMYGDFVSGEEGMGSWIVDYENVTDDDALKNYVDDLEVYDWDASYMSMTNMITGSKTGYSISVNMDPDYDTVQIIVREAN